MIYVTRYSPDAYSPVAAYTSSNLLIAIIGIAKYDGTQYNDYWNVKQTFHVIRGCSMVYFNENDELIYINETVDKTNDVEYVDMFNE